MKKLQIEELQVESFTTSASETYRGTVVGNMSPTYRVSECPGYCTDTGGGQSQFCHSPQCTTDCHTVEINTCNGATMCGTCGPDHTCGGDYGCMGTSFDMQIC